MPPASLRLYQTAPLSFVRELQSELVAIEVLRASEVGNADEADKGSGLKHETSRRFDLPTVAIRK